MRTEVRCTESTRYSTWPVANTVQLPARRTPLVPAVLSCPISSFREAKEGDLSPQLRTRSPFSSPLASLPHPPPEPGGFLHGHSPAVIVSCSSLIICLSHWPVSPMRAGPWPGCAHTVPSAPGAGPGVRWGPVDEMNEFKLNKRVMNCRPHCFRAEAPRGQGPHLPVCDVCT